LDAFIREQVGDPAKQPHWLSVYLGSEQRIPRIYTTLPAEAASEWRHTHNGMAISADLSLQGTSLTTRLDRIEDGEPVITTEYDVLFRAADASLTVAIAFETQDPDSLLGGGWGAFEREASFSFAADIAAFLGVTRETSRGETLASDILPREFEELIATLLEKMGYSVILTPEQKDGGKDILAYLSSELGSLLMLVECKKWRPDRPVRVDVVRGVYGVLAARRAAHATIVTTSHFTKDAYEFRDAVKYQMSLKDIDDVTRWIRRYA